MIDTNATPAFSGTDIASTLLYNELLPQISALFTETRKAGCDAQRIQNIQQQVAILLLEIQAHFNDADKRTIQAAKRLHWLTRRIMDGVAWRVLNYRRILVHLLSDHNQTGIIDNTIHDDLAKAQLIIDKHHCPVLVNDLTHLLLYGDLTIMRGSLPTLQENKTGQGSAKSGKAINQKHKREEMEEFLRKRHRVRKNGSHDYIIIPSSPLETYHAALKDALDQAYQQRDAQLVVNDIIAIEVIKSGGPAISTDFLPFGASPDVVKFSSHQLLDTTPKRIVPFSIFPFDDDRCFSLLTGEVEIKIFLNLSALAQRYLQAGMELILPQFTTKQEAAYQTASIAEKRRIQLQHPLGVKYGSAKLTFSYAHLWPIAYEGVAETSLIASDLAAFRHFKGKRLPPSVGFYRGFKGEDTIWR